MYSATCFMCEDTNEVNSLFKPVHNLLLQISKGKKKKPNDINCAKHKDTWVSKPSWAVNMWCDVNKSNASKQ